MDLEGVIDKLNVKEFVAIVAGLVASRMANSVLPADKKDIIKVGAGFAGSFVANELATRSPKYAVPISLVGLGLTAFAADPVADRVTIEVSKSVGAPIVVKANPVVVEAVETVETEKAGEELAIEL